MSADFNSFNEAFSSLREAMGVDGPQGSSKLPFWVKYVEAKAGDSIDSVIETGFNMHAAVTGKKLFAKSLKLEDVSIKDIIDDIKSKDLNHIVSQDIELGSGVVGFDCLHFFLSDNSFCAIAGSAGVYALRIFSFDEDIISFVIKNIEFHKSK